LEPLGFALVGLDHWYNAFPMADAILAVDSAQLRWVVGDDEERTQSVARRFDCVQHTGDFELVLKDPAIQVVTSFVSSEKSAELCIAAAEAGKHIISIKPMAMNLDEADRVVDAVTGAGTKYFPGSASHLFFAANQVFKKWIDEGRIGKLVAASSTFHAGLPRDWMDSASPGWFADPSRVPGGAWIDHAIFYLQVFRKWFGAEIVEVEGKIANLKYPDVAVEDYGQGIFTLSNGAVVTATSTWLGAPGAHRHSLEFFGSDGTLVWDSMLNKVAVAGRFGEEFSGWIQVAKPSEPISRTASMIEHLIECIQDDATPVCTVEDDRIALAAALAFYEAARARRPISL
jgi:predicted dehydrogenase